MAPNNRIDTNIALKRERSESPSPTEDSFEGPSPGLKRIKHAANEVGKLSTQIGKTLDDVGSSHVGIAHCMPDLAAELNWKAAISRK